MHPEEPEESPAVFFWTVAVYLKERAYGGAEEGGWWYTRGTRVDDPEEHGVKNVPLVCYSEEVASTYCKIVNLKLEAGINKNLPPVSSVSSQGRYAADVCPGYPPLHFPAQRPHYE